MLSETWITDHTIDFEYKKYLLLAYFKEVEDYFSQTKLYPYYSGLKNHYKTLIDFMNKKNQFCY